MLLSTRAFEVHWSSAKPFQSFTAISSRDSKMRTIKIIMMVALMFCASLASGSSAAVYDVVKLGAKPDGKTDCTNSFLKAWTLACSSSSAATIYVPPGRYLVQQMVFSGEKCKSTARRITFRIDGTLVAPSDYRVLGSIGKWIEFDSVKTGVSINGGTLDGQGAALWACKLAGTKSCPESLGATSLLFTNSKDIIINRVRSINSQMFHIVIKDCQNVNVQGVTVMAAGNSPNTDGIHVQSSTNVAIIGADIKTGDDCISIGPGTSDLWIQQISCGPGHGISIGSLGKVLNEPGVQNVTVKTATFTGTENGFRIKTWGRPSNGFVQGVLFEDATMNNVQNPIIIDQNYCPHEEDCPDQVSGVTISDVRYKDIRGSSATRVAVKFDCSKKSRCRGITLENVKLSFGNEPALSSCINADGTSSGLVQPASCLL